MSLCTKIDFIIMWLSLLLSLSFSPSILCHLLPFNLSYTLGL